METFPFPLLTRVDSLIGIDFEAGSALLVDKPAGISSFKVVRRVRRLCAVRKVGHCGTLDPAATGLLILLTGRATRRQNQFMRLDKEYAARILLGVETDTWDLDGKVTARRVAPDISREEVAHLLRDRFCGEFDQTPPAFSALKSGGIPNYRRARRGEIVRPQKRLVKVHWIELQHWSPPELGIRLACSSGFYVRSLAYEIGQQLGCGAVLKSLARTRIGTHRLEDGWRLEELEQILKSQETAKATCPT